MRQAAQQPSWASWLVPQAIVIRKRLDEEVCILASHDAGWTGGGIEMCKQHWQACVALQSYRKAYRAVDLVVVSAWHGS